MCQRLKDFLQDYRRSYPTILGRHVQEQHHRGDKGEREGGRGDEGEGKRDEVGERD